MSVKYPGRCAVFASLLCGLALALMVVLGEETTRVQSKCAQERGLVTENVKYQHLTSESRLFCDRKKINRKKFDDGQEQEVLAYVNDRNKRGFDVTSYFEPKITWFTPEWLAVSAQFVRKSENGNSVFSFNVKQTEYAKPEWIKEVQFRRDENNDGMLGGPNGPHESSTVIPKLQLDQMDSDVFKTMINEAAETIAVKVIGICQENFFGGIVLDMPLLWLLNEDKKAHEFIQLIGAAFIANDMLLFLEIPAEHFFRSDFRAVYNSVHRFIISGYEYSADTPGPAAPISWLQKRVDQLVSAEEGEPAMSKEKLILALPFYGRAWKISKQDGSVLYTGIVKGVELKRMIREHKPEITFDKGEHSMQLITRGVDTPAVVHVWFPSLYFLQERIEWARKQHMHVAIYDAGQGLDYYWDLL